MFAIVDCYFERSDEPVPLEIDGKPNYNKGPVKPATPAALTLRRMPRALKRQNLALAAIYDAVAGLIAMAGLATPLIAAAAMSGP